MFPCRRVAASCTSILLVAALAGMAHALTRSTSGRLPLMTTRSTIMALRRAAIYAYAETYDSLHVLSMADPRHPTEVGHCSTANAEGIDVVGDTRMSRTGAILHLGSNLSVG